MSYKPKYSWWIALALVAVVSTVWGGCFLPAYQTANQTGYVRTSGTAYTWKDVPRYNGHAVYFNRLGQPMVYRSGAWYYVPSTAVGYSHYRAYHSRIRLCRSGVRNAYYTRYCSPGAYYRRVQVRNAYRSRYYRSSPRSYRRSYRPTRPYTTRPYTTRRSTTSPTRRLPALGSGRSYDSSGRYRGRTDRNGRSYDSSGRYRGRTDSNGRSYDSSGRYRGRTDSNGRMYDASGRYQGRVDKNGRMYDASGRYKGRVQR